MDFVQFPETCLMSRSFCPQRISTNVLKSIFLETLVYLTPGQIVSFAVKLGTKQHLPRRPCSSPRMKMFSVSSCSSAKPWTHSVCRAWVSRKRAAVKDQAQRFQFPALSRLSLSLNLYSKESNALVIEKTAYQSMLVKTNVQKWKPLRTKLSSS